MRRQQPRLSLSDGSRGYSADLWWPVRARGFKRVYVCVARWGDNCSTSVQLGVPPAVARCGRADLPNCRADDVRGSVRNLTVAWLQGRDLVLLESNLAHCVEKNVRKRTATGKRHGLRSQCVIEGPVPYKPPDNTETTSHHERRRRQRQRSQESLESTQKIVGVFVWPHACTAAGSGLRCGLCC